MQNNEENAENRNLTPYKRQGSGQVIFYLSNKQRPARNYPGSATSPVYSLMTGPKTRIQVRVAEFLLIRKA